MRVVFECKNGAATTCVIRSTFYSVLKARAIPTNVAFLNGLIRPPGPIFPLVSAAITVHHDNDATVRGHLRGNNFLKG